MSRIGKQFITIPEKVKVKLDMPVFDFFALGLIGTASALGGGVPLIPALICGSISGGFSDFGGQCPAELDSIAVGELTKIGAQRAGEVVMLSSDAGDFAQNLCKAYAYATMGTALGTAIEQNQLCVTACETLPQVAIMSGYKSCKVCCWESTIAGFGRATELLVDVV